MAVTTTNRLAGPYIGNGTATSFPFNFKVFSFTDLFILREDSGGNLTVLAYGTDYTVSLNQNQDTSPGGSVTLVAGPLSVGCRMTITSDVAQLQQVVLTNLGGFFPEVLNAVFDRLTILIQQLQVDESRSIRMALTDDLATAQLPSAPLRANKFLYFGADGSLGLLASSPFGTAVFSGNLSGAQDGINRVFTMTNAGQPLGVTPLQVTVWRNFPLIPNDPNGYVLGPLAGQVTFATAPSSGDSLFASGVFSS